MGLRKKILKQWVESGCDRQLFLSLVEALPSTWTQGPLEVAKHDTSQGGAGELGKQYEQAVYKQLEGRPWALAALDSRGQTTTTRLRSEKLKALSQEPRPWSAIGDEAWCLIEHQWPLSQGWLSDCLGQARAELKTLRAENGALRPDLMLVTPGETLAREGFVRALGSKGDIKTLNAEEAVGRFGIQLIEIKRTHERRVGKRHFVELAYYAQALRVYLEDEGISDLFFVCCDGHGVFPRLEPLPLIESGGHLRALCVPARWEDAVFLLEQALEKVRVLWAGRPWVVDDVEVNVQASCGRCGFFEDCMARLSGDGGRRGLDVRLMPYVSRSLAAQLRSYGLHTVGDVATRLLKLDLGDTPTALHPERPVLALQAKAIVKGQRLTAKQAKMGEAHLSVSAPRDCTARLVVDAETDPTSDVVFAVGLHLRVGSGALGLKEIERAWWGFWRTWLKEDCPLDPQKVAEVLHPLVGDVKAEIARFAASLQALSQQAHQVPAAASLEIGEGPIWLEARYAYTSDNNTSESERTLARNTLLGLHHMVALCDVIEALLWAPERDDEDDGGLSMHLLAGFYWSTEQITQLQEMLERHLEHFLNDDTMTAPLLSTMRLLAPSASAVPHPKQREKFFNLRAFIETSWGVPHLINCTWHGMARTIDPKAFLQERFSHYWAPHFNYMNHAPWHRLIAEPDFDRKYALRVEINEQLRFKLRSLHSIIDALFLDAELHAALVSRTSLAATTASLAGRVSPDWHALAKGWHLFAHLTAASQRAAADAARLTYVAKSIGQLVAAHAEQPRLRGAEIHLALRGLSANMKIAPGDPVLLVTQQDRDLSGPLLRKYEVQVASMRWNHTLEQQEVALTSFRQQHPYLRLADPDGYLQTDGPCYLYLTTFDAWTERLTAALQRRAIATSWLGHRLAFLWGLNPKPALQPPPKTPTDSAELFLFAPLSFPPLAPQTPRTTAHPKPDPSQARCIAHALQHTISCIQGPPGTGKSQTIAALVDAFVLQQPQTPRILITAASYAALHVLLDKLLGQRDVQGHPTAASQLTPYFARSAARQPVSVPGVQDLVVGARDVTLNGRKVGARWLPQNSQRGWVLFATPHQLVSLGAVRERDAEPLWLPQNFGFDLIIVDEASQMPTDQFLAVVALTKPYKTPLRVLDDQRQTPQWPAQSPADVAHIETPPNVHTQMVLVGDHHQLPPVQPVKPPEKLRVFLDSVFRFYVEGHQLSPVQLEINYRSHPEIVACTRLLNLYPHLEASKTWQRHPTHGAPSGGWVGDVLCAQRAVHVLIHDEPFQTAVSPVEARLTVACVAGALTLWNAQKPSDEEAFWREGVGVVTPHNAQGRLIIRSLYAHLSPRSLLPPDALMKYLQETVYSVEKFQGSDRVFMLASIGVSSPEQLTNEEHFIYDINRFNVLTSRAKQKMILICSDPFLRHIPSERSLMLSAGRIRELAFSFCNQSQSIQIGDEKIKSTIQHRWHQPLAQPKTQPPKKPTPQQQKQPKQLPKQPLQEAPAPPAAPLIPPTEQPKPVIPSYLLMAHNALTRRHSARHILEVVSHILQHAQTTEQELIKIASAQLGVVRLDPASEDFLVRCVRWTAANA